MSGSDRWLKLKPVPPAPNVSQSDVRRLQQEKATKAQPEQTTPVTTPAPTTVATPVTTPIEPTEGRAAPQYLDATHTASEQRIYSVMYRETITKGLRERHYGPKELCEKTGIRSDRTVRMAVRGLVEKLSVEVVSHAAYHPQGPRYRVFEPREVARRRRAAGMEIDPQTKKILTPIGATVATTVEGTVGAGAGGTTKNYSSTPVTSTGVSPVTSTGAIYKEENSIVGREVSAGPSSSNQTARDDDEAFARLRAAAREVTGKEATDWREVDELLAAEFKIAAGRTTVSSAPAFLAEHLRRRLWKKDKRQLSEEGKAETQQSAIGVNASKCPDCFGTGMWYPEGFEKGVARCRHEKLTSDKSEKRK